MSGNTGFLESFSGVAGRMMELLLKPAIAFFILASASLVEAQTIQTLCSFNYANGQYPYAGLTLGGDGNFYGTTWGGGSSNQGTVFKLTADGSLTTLYSFTGGNDGAYPYAGLTLGKDGDFYGTTWQGAGMVFKLTFDGTLTPLVSTTGHGSQPSGLTLGNDGNLYGTLADGGLVPGALFSVTTTGQYSVFAMFFGQCASGYVQDAVAGVILGNDGSFYGTSGLGGCGGWGSVFKVTTNGVVISLHLFYGQDGYSPNAQLTLGSDGYFYGTTPLGGPTSGTGSAGYGTVFRMAPSGSLETLYWFRGGTDGAYPQAALTLASDGNLYGTTSGGGIANSTNGMGTIFRITTTGSLTTLFAFHSTDGANPYAGLTLGNDGNFYGTTTYGGSSNQGTVFRLLLPPVITVQPQSQTHYAGHTVSFTVSGTNLNPIAYQWQKNGTNLVDSGNMSGSTNPTLTITSISDSDAASYSVVVCSSNICVTSSNAVLTVIDPPLITAQPSNLLLLLGTNAAFSVSVTSLVQVGYQWRHNGTNISGATSALYTIPSVLTNNAGIYSVVVTNSAGSTTSSNGALTVVLSPKSQTNYASTTAMFVATAFSPEPLSYRWQKNGTNLVEGGRLSGTTNSTLTIATVSDADAAAYSAVVSDAYASVTSSNATLTVNDSPFIASQPQSQTVLAGDTATFNVTVYGAPPFVFQWYFNGTPLNPPADGTNFSSCVLTNVGVNQAGNYTVEVVNGYGSLMSSNASLTVVTIPPAVTTQPASRTNNAGTTATFSVVASGLLPLSYQWQKNSTNLVNGGRVSGATTNILSITSVSNSDAATYSVIVTNLIGSTTSSNAILTVINPPVITTQPLSQRVLLGAGVSFNVSLNGTAPFHYQWRFNGSGIFDATNAVYAIQTVGANNAGSYSVVVTNPAGSATSSNAVLTVTIPPRLELEFWAGYPLLNLYGMLSSNYVVQYNSNLGGTNWINLLSLTNLSGSPYLFLDPAGDGEPARFYRAFMR